MRKMKHSLSESDKPDDSETTTPACVQKTRRTTIKKGDTRVFLTSPDEIQRITEETQEQTRS